MVTKNSAGVDRHLRKSRIKDPYLIKTASNSNPNSENQRKTNPNSKDVRGANSIFSTKHRTPVAPTRFCQQNIRRTCRQLDFPTKHRTSVAPSNSNPNSENQRKTKPNSKDVRGANSISSTKYPTPVTPTSFSIKMSDVNAKAQVSFQKYERNRVQCLELSAVPINQIGL